MTKNVLPGGTSVVAWNGTGWTNISGGQGFTYNHAATTGFLWAADNQRRIWFYSP
ncbi:MAG: hypothetical protein M3Y08_09745 [Fibrobacterota bacterium]|nr:hypothetical protein [Fibrobacterota bacterium]